MSSPLRPVACQSLWEKSSGSDHDWLRISSGNDLMGSGVELIPMNLKIPDTNGFCGDGKKKRDDGTNGKS
jgi:hypothetical protein